MAKKKKSDDFDFSDFDSMIDDLVSQSDAAADLDPSQALEWISSGNIAINLACSGHPNYAFPLGRIVNLEGDSDTGKTLLAQTAMREAQTKYTNSFRGLYIDTERGVVPKRLEQMGLFIKKKIPTGKTIRDIPEKKRDGYDTTDDPRAGTFRVVSTTDLTYLADKLIPPYLKALRANPEMCGILVIDSASMLVTSHERETDFETRDMARAQEIRKFMRLLNDTFPPNLIVFLIHHTSDVIATGFTKTSEQLREGNKTISGGRALKYVPDVRIEVHYGGKEYRGSGDKKVQMGQIARIKVKKTRLYTPNVEARAVIDHARGFTRTGGLFEMMDDLGLFKGVGSKSVSCPSVTGDKTYSSKDRMQDALEEDQHVPKVIDAILESMTVNAYGDEGPTEESAPKNEDAFAGIDDG